MYFINEIMHTHTYKHTARAEYWRWLDKNYLAQKVAVAKQTQLNISLRYSGHFAFRTRNQQHLRKKKLSFCITHSFHCLTPFVKSLALDFQFPTSPPTNITLSLPP